ncbi:MAG: hypothetical protein CVV24_14290 [Ignavibacteriae bacterium HGW-Ignavibacteriae-3]|nr:MAG: hypothetical protein CVV24_14290 [Ignavibacteriae bacterium HGW-Ignavibacteriae-3]
MKTLKLFGAFLIATAFLYGAAAIAQEKPDTTKTNKMIKHGHHMMHGMKHDSSDQHNMHDMKMMKDSTNKMEMRGMMMMGGKHKMDMDKKEKMNENKSPLIREGEIDLKAIDENKDGKVYQCQMDFNVISDKPGTDPECGMKFKEVTVKEAKEKLIKNGFIVK